MSWPPAPNLNVAPTRSALRKTRPSAVVEHEFRAIDRQLRLRAGDGKCSSNEDRRQSELSRSSPSPRDRLPYPCRAVDHPRHAPGCCRKRLDRARWERGQRRSMVSPEGRITALIDRRRRAGRLLQAVHPNALPLVSVGPPAVELHAVLSNAVDLYAVFAAQPLGRNPGGAEEGSGRGGENERFHGIPLKLTKSTIARRFQEPRGGRPRGDVTAVTIMSICAAQTAMRGPEAPCPPVILVIISAWPPRRHGLRNANAHFPSRRSTCGHAGLAARGPAMADANAADRDRDAGGRQPGFRQPAAGGEAQRAARPGRGGGEFNDYGRGGVEHRRKVAARRLPDQHVDRRVLGAGGGRQIASLRSDQGFQLHYAWSPAIPWWSRPRRTRRSNPLPS